MANSIPVVSFEKFLTGNRADQQEVAKKVYAAFSSVGFIYLNDHGIPESRVQQVFALVCIKSPFVLGL
jgi:isopenicillin N synthase-like dioxygenase